MPKTIATLYDNKQRAFALFLRRTTKLAEQAHPETGGNQQLVLNWGNDAARAVWRRGWDRWRRYDAAYRRAYDLALHDEHGPLFRPLWCQHCKASTATLTCN